MEGLGVSVHLPEGRTKSVAAPTFLGLYGERVWPGKTGYGVPISYAVHGGWLRTRNQE